PDPSPGHDEPGSFEGAHDLSSDRSRDLVLRLDVVETQDLADGQLAVDDLLGDRLDHRAVQHFCWHMPSDLRWPRSHGVRERGRPDLSQHQAVTTGRASPSSASVRRVRSRFTVSGAVKVAKNETSIVIAM